MIIHEIDISLIKPYKNNPRNNDNSVGSVAASIKQFGWIWPILLDQNNEIVAGHTRYKAALQLGLSTVPCMIAENLTDEQVKAFRLVDNKTAELSEWNPELLKIELAELAELNLDFNMADFGFETKKTEMIEDDFDLDENLKNIIQPTTKRGQIWKLGDHRLMCGDATCEQDVEQLMGCKSAQMVFTDPPYNVNVTGGTKEKLKIQNDNMKDKDFYNFLYKAFVNLFNATESGGAVYICHADSEGLNFRNASIESGWLLKQCIIWVKNNFCIGRQDHQWQHEPILYGWKPGKHKWYGGRNQSTVIKAEDGVFINKTGSGYQITFNNGVKKVVLDVPDYKEVAIVSDETSSIWYVDKPVRNGEHPTMKPIKLCARAIRNSSTRGDIVLDLFGGSGSTMMASEQTGRCCYCMEFDEKYCDVIIKRWEEFTGKKADLVHG